MTAYDSPPSPDVLAALTDAVRTALTPTVELTVRDGKLWVTRKDRGVRVVIHDYDEHQEGAVDTLEDWELIQA